MIALAVIAAAVLTAAFFTLAELTIISTGRLRLRQWVLDSMRGATWLGPEDFDRPYRLLSPIHVGHTLAVTVGAMAATVALYGFTGRSMLAHAGWTGLLFVPPLYLAAEVLPRIVVGGRAHQLFPAIAWVLRACHWVFGPVLALSDCATRFLLHRMGHTLDPEGAFSRRTLEGLLVESERVGIVERQEREIIAGVFEFGRTPVHRVMTPAAEIASASRGMCVGDIAALVRQTGYSRIPIEGEDPGRIVGMVHTFDLLKLAPGDWPSLRPVVTTRGDTACDEVLIEMKRQRCHLAIVVEHGVAIGMVTLNDLVEELVGEIRDEHDERAS